MKCATRLRIGITDDITAQMARIDVEPATWYYGIDVRLVGTDDAALGMVSMPSVRFAQNLTTVYSGGIMGAGRSISLTADDAERLRTGVYIDGGHFCAAHELEITGEIEGYITLTEGRYHQIKQMLYAVGNEITYLERITFGPLTLDTSLERGEWRYLTDSEVAALYSAAGL